MKGWNHLLFLGGPTGKKMKRMSLFIATSPDWSCTKQSLTKVITDDSRTPHSSVLIPFFFFFFTHTNLLPHSASSIFSSVSQTSSLSLILCSFSQCADIGWCCRIQAYWRVVYCPNLRELALKTMSRASQVLEVAQEEEEEKQVQTWLYICWMWGRGAACRGQPGGWEEDWSGLSD